MEGRVVGREGRGKDRAYAVVDYMLVSSVVVDVDCDAAEGGDFGGEFGEAGVVLSVWVGGLDCVRRLAHGGTYCSRSYDADMMAVGCACIAVRERVSRVC